MHTNWCVLIEISMEIGMLNFWLPLLVTAQTKENYFSKALGIIFFTDITTVNDLPNQFALVRLGKKVMWEVSDKYTSYQTLVKRPIE
jgi:hypothetical protein